MSSPESAGAIVSEIRLALTQLQKDTLQAQKMMDNLAGKFSESGSVAGKSFTNGVKNGLEALKSLGKEASAQFANEMKNITAAEKAGVVAAEESANARLAALNSYLRGLVELRTQTAAAAGENNKMVKSYDALIKKQLAHRDALKNQVDIYRKTGESGGKMYVQGFGKAQVELNKKLNDMVSSLSALPGRMGQLGGKMGEKLAGLFSKPIFAMIPAVSMAFQAMLPVIGTVLVAVGALIKGISAAAKSQKEFTDNVNLSKTAQDALTKTINGAIKTSKEQNDIEERKSVALAKVRLAFQAMMEPLKQFGAKIKELTDTALVWFLERIGDITHGLAIFTGALSVLLPAMAPAAIALEAFSKSMKRVGDEEAKAAADAQKLAGVNKEVDAAFKEYEKQLHRVETEEKAESKTAEELARARLSAAEGYLDKLIELREEAERLTSAENARVKELDRTIAAQVRQRDSMAETVAQFEKLKSVQKDEKSDAEKIDEARLAAIEKYEQAVKTAHDAKEAGLINELELQNRLNTALSQEYADMEAIAAQYRKAEGEAKKQLDKVTEIRDAVAETVKLNESGSKMNALIMSQEDALKQMEIDQYKALAESADSEDRKNALLDRAIELENELIKAQRARAREALEQSAEFINASGEVQQKILKDFDKITAGMLKFRNETGGDKGKESGIWDLFGFSKEAYDLGMAIGQQALSAFDTISNAALEVSRKHAEEQIAIIDSALEKLQEQIEAARTAELEAAGFIEAQSEEEFDRQIEAAQKAGDEVLEYHLRRRKQEMEINKKYDEQAKAAEEAAAREKAQIEYKLALEEHAMRIVNAVSTGIMAVLDAMAAGWSVGGVAAPVLAGVFGGIAGAATAVQIAALAANPPKPPAFADGGIVPGNSYSGDNVSALVNSGELILNRAQQDNVAGQLSGGETVIYLNLYLDGQATEALAEGVFRIANATGSVLEKRVIRGLR